MIKLKYDEFQINKDNLLEYFPNCLFSVILEQDPTTEVIEITQPFMDTESLALIASIINNGKVPDKFTPSPALSKIGDYLNMSLLSVIANPKYFQYTGLHLVEWKKFKNQAYYKTIINDSVRTDYPELLQYLFEVVPGQQVFDQSFFISAIKSNAISLIPLFLKRDVDPNYNEGEPLRKASKKGYIEIVQMLLHHIKDPILQYGPHILLEAITHDKELVAMTLLEDGRITLDTGILLIAVQHNIPKVLEFLLKYPEVDPSNADNLPLLLAINNGHVRNVEILLRDPRVDPNARDGVLIRLAGEDLNLFHLFLTRKDTKSSYIQDVCRQRMDQNPRIVTYVLHDSRVDINDLLYYAIRRIIPSVVKLILKESIVEKSTAKNYLGYLLYPDQPEDVNFIIEMLQEYINSS